MLQEAIAESIPNESSDKALALAALRVLRFPNRIDWTSFEFFCRDYQALRLLLAYRFAGRGREGNGLAKGVVTVAELHHGAWIGNEIGSLPVRLTDVSSSSSLLVSPPLSALGDVGQLKHRFPAAYSIDRTKEVEGLEVGKVYLNAKNALCDVAVTLPYDTLDDPDAKLVTLYECKHTTKNLEVDQTQIEDSIDKALEPLRNSTAAVEGFFAFVAFMSNRAYKEKQGEKNATFDSLVKDLAMSKSKTINRSVVVVEQNAEAYVGPNMYGRSMSYLGTGGGGEIEIGESEEA
jgi:hypothetical protein